MYGKFAPASAVTVLGSCPVRWGYVKHIEHDDHKGEFSYVVIMMDDDRPEEVWLEDALRKTTQDDLDSLRPPEEPKARPLTVGDLRTLLAQYPDDLLVVGQCQEVFDFVTAHGVELCEDSAHHYLSLDGKQYEGPVLEIWGDF